jgi:glutamine cyclotransferase
VSTRLLRLLPLFALLASSLGAACDRAQSDSLDADAPFEIVAEFPHDTGAYTQGLIWQDSTLYESTGRYGDSEVRRVDLRTGAVLSSTPLAPDRFGEGLALLDGRLYQLTWESKVGYVYDAKSLARVDSFTYAGEGWGLATDGTSLIMSDGSDSLRFLSPPSMATAARGARALPGLATLEDPTSWVHRWRAVRQRLRVRLGGAHRSGDGRGAAAGGLLRALATRHAMQRPT